MGPAWKVDSGQLYQTVKALERDGLIERVAEGDPEREERHVFSITAEGVGESLLAYGSVPGYLSLLRELIARADALYEEGSGAIALLRDGGAATALAAALYREILRQIERDGFGARPGRAVVPANARMPACRRELMFSVVGVRACSPRSPGRAVLCWRC